MPTKFYLLRHAEGWHNSPPSDYSGDVYSDPLFRDAELTPIGIEQCLAKSYEISNIAFDAIYCSPLRRCRQTLLHVKPDAAHLNVRVDDRLIEQPTGKNICDCRLERCTIVYDSPGKWDLSGVASENPFLKKSDELDRQKIRSFTEMIVRKYPEGRILIVTHGTWIYRWTEMFHEYGVLVGNCQYVRTTARVD
jgi:broad specificity phosphatase PhoE